MSIISLTYGVMPRSVSIFMVEPRIFKVVCICVQQTCISFELKTSSILIMQRDNRERKLETGFKIYKLIITLALTYILVHFCKKTLLEREFIICCVQGCKKYERDIPMYCTVILFCLCLLTYNATTDVLHQ